MTVIFYKTKRIIPLVERLIIRSAVVCTKSTKKNDNALGGVCDSAFLSGCFQQAQQYNIIETLQRVLL